MEPNVDQPSVRRVVLPSGRTIDVVLVVPARAGTEAPVRRSAPDSPECCPQCAGDLVQPVDWDVAPAGGWRVHLRCPNCAREDDVVMDQDQVDRYDEVLDRGAQALATDLDRLERANREDAVRRFAALLEDGVLRPQDFA